MYYLRIVSFLFCLATIGQSQMSFRNLNVTDGLSQNSVTSISQDSLGVLWIATQDGLNAYDGHFTYYPFLFDDITRPDYKILGKSYVDGDGLLWVIAKGGKLHRFNRSDRLFNEIALDFEVLDIIEIADDSYIIVDRNQSVHIWSSERGVIKSTKMERLRIHSIRYINESYLLLTDRGLYSLDVEDLSIKTYDERLQKLSISSLAVGEKDQIYIGTFGQGLWLYDKVSNELKKWSKLPDAIIIYDLIWSGDFLWIATYGDGLYRISADLDISHFTPNKSDPSAISYHDILDLHVDKFGALWAGTDGAGIDYYDPYLNKFGLAMDDALQGSANIEVIRAICTSSDYIFLGTSGHGLTIHDKSTGAYTTYSSSDGLSNDRVMSLLADGSQLLVGYQEGGIDIISFEDAQLRSIRNDLKNLTIWSITKAVESQKYWLTTRNNGLLLYDVENGIENKIDIRNQQGSPASLRDLDFISPDMLWIATDQNGIFLYDVIQNQIKQIENGPKELKAISVAPDYLYVGTNGKGLWSYDYKGGWDIVANRDSGLVNDVIYGVEGILGKDMWVSTNRGISNIKIDKNKGTSILNYGPEDGLQYYEFNTGASFEDENGIIYFGGIKGYNWIVPAAIPINQNVPTPILKKLHVGHKDWRIDGTPIKLSPSDNNFTISYSSMQLTSPKRSKFQYRLKNYDNDWATTDADEITYMNMPAGNYIFELKSANYDGIWSEKAVEQKIILGQHWYLSNWFKGLILGLIGLILYVLYDSRQKQLKAQKQLEAEELRNEMINEVNQAKSDFYTQVTHEFRTPITIINGITSKLDITKDAKEVILKNSNRLLELVNQLLERAQEKDTVTAFELPEPNTTDVEPLKVGVPIIQRNIDEEGQERPKVLVVEDNKDLLYYITSIIEADYSILTAIDGKKGIKEANKEVPDVIITDLMMPVMDGMEMIKLLKEDLNTSHIPVIVLTAKADYESKLSGLKIGADAYLVKPFDEAELLIRIKTILDNRKRLQDHYANTDHTPMGQKEDAFLMQVKACILKNVANESFGIQQICQEVFLERTQLYRKVKALTGLTPSELIKQIRMQQAWKMLKNDNYQIYEVAYACGFKEASYFSKVFKEYFGYQPSEVKLK